MRAHWQEEIARLTKEHTQKPRDLGNVALGGIEGGLQDGKVSLQMRPEAEAGARFLRAC